MEKDNQQLQKTKLQTKNKYELNRRRALIGKQIESIKEKKLNGRKQKRNDMVEDIDSGRFFQLATSNKSYINGSNLHAFKVKFC